jgi:uncharacterized protein YbjT (DUF2867 family)
VTDERQQAASRSRSATAGEADVLTGPPSLTQIDRVRIIGETIGRPLRLEEQPREQFREQLLLHHGLPAPVIDELLE